MCCDEEEGKIVRSFVPISRNNGDAHTVSRRKERNLRERQEEDGN